MIRDEVPGEPLYQAVREADVAHAHRPADLVAELVGSGDPVLQAESLRLARQGLYAGLLARRTRGVRCATPPPTCWHSLDGHLADGAWGYQDLLSGPALLRTVMLDDPRPVVRRAAAEGLRRMGAAAVPALRHAAGRARPDKRGLYLDALADVRSTEGG